MVSSTTRMRHTDMGSTIERLDIKLSD